MKGTEQDAIFFKSGKEYLLNHEVGVGRGRGKKRCLELPFLSRTLSELLKYLPSLLETYIKAGKVLLQADYSFTLKSFSLCSPEHSSTDDWILHETFWTRRVMGIMPETLVLDHCLIYPSHCPQVLLWSGWSQSESPGTTCIWGRRALKLSPGVNSTVFLC